MDTLRVSRYAQIVDDPRDLSGALLVSLSRKAGDPVLRVPEEIADLLREDKVEQLDWPVRAALAKRGILVSSALDELQSIVDENHAHTARSRTLQRIVMPSANCPHGCNMLSFGGYCGQSHTHGSLSKSALSSINTEISVHLSSGEYDLLDLGIFGGEPLLAYDEVLCFLESIQAVCTTHRVALHANITTSGLLFTVDRAKALFSAGLKDFDVTLDGRESQHDSRRATKGGKPTFSTIYQNLLAIATDHGLDKLVGTIRMNVDRRNQEDVLPLLDQLITDGLVPRFNFYVSPIRNLGPNLAGSIHLDRRRLAELELAIIRKTWDIGLASDPLPERTFTICPAVNPHAAVIDPFGLTHRCTETPLVSLTSLMPPGFGQSDDWRPAWNGLINSGDIPCSKCALFPVCGGACPKDWLQGNVPCPIYKENVKERVVLASCSNAVDLEEILAAEPQSAVAV